MVAFSMYRGNLHIGGRDGDAAAPPDPLREAFSAASCATAPSPSRASRGRRRPARPSPRSVFRRLLRNRSLAGAPPRPGSPSSDGGRGAVERDGVVRDKEGAEQLEEQEEEEQQQQQDVEENQQQPEEEDGEEEQQQHQAEEEEQEDGAVEDADMDDAGEVVVEGDGNGDAEEGQGESEGIDTNQVSYPDQINEKKRKLNEKLDLVQMLKQVLNAEEEIRRRSMQASLRATMPQPTENATDGSSVSRLGPRMTVDVNLGDVAGDSDAGSNQGTPGRPLHHFHSISPSTASFVRSPFGSLQGHTPRSPATFSMASPSRFAASGHHGQPPGLHSASLPGANYVASSPSPAASGGSSSVFRDPRPPNST